MNQNELKELAEWSAEFLGFFRELKDTKYSNMGAWHGFDLASIVSNDYIFGIQDDELPSVFFDDSTLTPILMHIAQVEMEKRGYMYMNLVKWGENDYSCDLLKSGGLGVGGQGENKFIAFWSAVHEAMKGGE